MIFSLFYALYVPPRNKVVFALFSHVENTLKINQDEYEEGTEYCIDKGYGAKLFLMKYGQEKVDVIKNITCKELMQKLKQPY